MTVKTSNKAKKLSPAQERVIAVVGKAGTATDTEIAEAVGGTISNAFRSAEALVKKGALVKDGSRYTLPEAVEVEKVADAIKATGETLITADLEKAMSEAGQRLGKELLLTPSGSGAKMVTISNACYLTTDGSFVVAKGTTDGTEKEPWALYQIVSEDNGARGVEFVGTFKTCTAAFGKDGVLR